MTQNLHLMIPFLYKMLISRISLTVILNIPVLMFYRLISVFPSDAYSSYISQFFIQLRILGNLLLDKTDNRITIIKSNIIFFLAILSLSADCYNDVKLSLTKQVFVILYFHKSAAFL